MDKTTDSNDFSRIKSPVHIQFSYINHRYFPVDIKTDIAAATPIEARIKQLLDAAKELDEKHQRELNKIQDNPPFETLTPFEHHTAWPIKYKNKDMKALVELMKKPDKEEYLLLQAWNNMRSMLAKHFDGVWDLHHRNWHVIPFWLASAHSQQAESVPFRRYFDPQTLNKYAEIWQRYIIFCLITYKNDKY